VGGTCIGEFGFVCPGGLVRDKRVCRVSCDCACWFVFFCGVGGGGCAVWLLFFFLHLVVFSCSFFWCLFGWGGRGTSGVVWEAEVVSPSQHAEEGRGREF